MRHTSGVLETTHRDCAEHGQHVVHTRLLGTQSAFMCVSCLIRAAHTKLNLTYTDPTATTKETRNDAR